jgi:hypothetical protein
MSKIHIILKTVIPDCIIRLQFNLMNFTNIYDK